jgi:hypothetical protein
MAGASKTVKETLLRISDCNRLLEEKIKEGTECSMPDNTLAGKFFLLKTESFEEVKNAINKIKTLSEPAHLPDQNSIKEDLRALKRDILGIKRLITDNSSKIKRDAKKVSLILQEYKNRCRNSLIDFLKTLDLDLRKALKPLVPNQVLQEQLKYKPINSGAVFISSISSNTIEEEKPSENTVDKLNNHIQLLINTLEGVAKDLISITQATNQKYYELVDPLVLYSEPPSPLAAPLPDYFSYDLVNFPEESHEYTRAPIVMSDQAKKKLLEKFKVLEKQQGPNTTGIAASRIQDKLIEMFKSDIKEVDLMELFKEEGMPMSEREKIVFEMINTDRTKGRDVSLDDIIRANDIDLTNPNFEVSRNNYSRLLRNIQGKELTDRFEDHEEFSSLQSSIDEKIIKNPSRIAFSYKKHSTKEVSILPPISLVRSKSKKPLRNESKPSLNDFKARNITPNKLSNKIHARRSHTPGLKSKKKI